MPLFLREHYNGMYRVDTYFITKQVTFYLVKGTVKPDFFLSSFVSTNMQLCGVVPEGRGNPQNREEGLKQTGTS